MRNGLLSSHTHTHIHARLARAETNASPHITLYNREKIIMTKDKKNAGKKVVGIRTAGGNKSPADISCGPCLCEKKVFVENVDPLVSPSFTP